MSDAQRIPNIYRAGRPKGATNYSGISLLAKQMKKHGMSWLDEICDVYATYKKDASKLLDSEKWEGKTPDQTLIKFWTAALPFLSLTIDARITRAIRQRERRDDGKKLNTTKGLELLAQLEGRTRSTP